MASDLLKRGLLDTSIFIAREAGRPLGELPDTVAVSVVTLAELHLGVLMAHGAAVRARRLRTLTALQNAFEPLPIDNGSSADFRRTGCRSSPPRFAPENHGHLDRGNRTSPRS